MLMVVGVGELTYTSRQLMMSKPQHYAAILGLVIVLYAGLAAFGTAVVRWLETRFVPKSSPERNQSQRLSEGLIRE